MRCRLCDSNRLLSVLDLGATPPCETFLTADELDSPEPTFPLHLRLCEDCLLLQIPALITPEATFTEYAYFKIVCRDFKLNSLYLKIERLRGLIGCGELIGGQLIVKDRQPVPVRKSPP